MCVCMFLRVSVVTFACSVCFVLCNYLGLIQMHMQHVAMHSQENEVLMN